VTRARRRKLVILGMMGRCPFGGQTWLYLNWVRALERAGAEVWYVEDDSVWPYDPARETVTDDPSYAVRHIATSMERIGAKDRWAYRLADGARPCFGLTSERLDALYRGCDALLNIVGATDLREEHMAAPMRVYVETDPVTAELRLDMGDEHTRRAFAGHDRIVTYGENYGAPDCGVPLSGIAFGKTRQPIDLELWPAAIDPTLRDWTTIGNYRQEGSDVLWRGESYRWSKHHEWEKVLSVPARTGASFRMGMWPKDARDKALLEKSGFRLESPLALSLDIFGAYPAYFRGSRAAFTVAKDQNVRLRSGWFSEREACYLASGKPVVTQDTGMGCALPLGEGLLAFRTADEAVEAVRAVEGDYERHARAARRIAEEHLEAGLVGRRFLETIGLA